MTMTARLQVECEQLHPGLPVSDVLAAADFYAKKLGFWVAFTWGDPPTMAGVNLGNVQIFLEQGAPNPKGCELYFVVGDAGQALRVPTRQRRRDCDASGRSGLWTTRLHDPRSVRVPARLRTSAAPR